MRWTRLITVLLLLAVLPASAQDFRSWADTLAQYTGYAPTDGNEVYYTKSGEEFLRLLLEDIQNAKESVNLEFYWFDTDKTGKAVREALMAKSAQGIKVRVLMDNLVTPEAPDLFYAKMKQAGVEVLYAHDFQKMGLGESLSTFFLQRDHRKLAVIDHHIGYTGGINLCDHAIYEWTDMGVRVKGPAAASMEALVERAWVLAGGSSFEVPQSQGEGPVTVQVFPGWASRLFEDIFVQTIHHAREYLYIQTPYYVPPDVLQEELMAAARRGVDVRILMTKSDHGFMDQAAQNYFEDLLAAGVKLSVQRGHFDHSKAFVSDHSVASCGTLNLDKRSFRINWENTLLFYDASLADTFTTLFLDLEAQATPVQPGESVAKGFQKPWRSFLRWISPIL